MMDVVTEIIESEGIGVYLNQGVPVADLKDPTFLDELANYVMDPSITTIHLRTTLSNISEDVLCNVLRGIDKLAIEIVWYGKTEEEWIANDGVGTFGPSMDNLYALAQFVSEYRPKFFITGIIVQCEPFDLGLIETKFGTDPFYRALYGMLLESMLSVDDIFFG